MTNQGDDRESCAREAVRRARRNVPWLFSKEDNRQFFRAHLEVQGVEFLVEAAREGDFDSLEILREHARGARNARMSVPADFHAFVWECFIDGPPKAKPGPGPKDIELRNQTIAILVKKVSQDYGFQEYRNPEHRGNEGGPMTACRLVAEEFGLSERTVEDIWGDRKASVTRSV